MDVLKMEVCSVIYYFETDKQFQNAFLFVFVFSLSLKLVTYLKADKQ